jgi:acetyltransferase-like isoleucine patch superfamily enzyme
MINQITWRIIASLIGGDRASRWLGVKVGQGCRICPCNFGTEPWLVSIGDRVTVAPGVAFLTHDGSTWLFRDARGRRYKYARIDVGSDVFIGLNAILMPGVKVGSRVVIGAGSVVTHSVSDGQIVAGNPAKVIGVYADLESRILRSGVTSSDMVGADWRAKVSSITEQGFRTEIGQ